MNDTDLELKELSYFDYMFQLMDRRNALSDYYVKEALSGSGKIYALYKDSFPVTYLVLNIEGNKGNITYLHTDEKYRHRGYATQILNSVVKTDMLNYQLFVSSKDEYAQTLADIAKANGFRIQSTSTIYTADTDERMWEHMEAVHMDRMCSLMLPEGGKCISFSDLSPKELELLNDSPRSLFRNQLEPSFLLFNKHKYLDKDLSFALISDDGLMAYTLITRPEKTHVVVEQISTAEEYLGKGLIICPLYFSLSAIRNKPEIKKMTLTIHDTNADSLGFSLKILEGIDLRKTSNCVFVKD